MIATHKKGDESFIMSAVNVFGDNWRRTMDKHNLKRLEIVGSDVSLSNSTKTNGFCNVNRKGFISMIKDDVIKLPCVRKCESTLFRLEVICI